MGIKRYLRTYSSRDGLYQHTPHPNAPYNFLLPCCEYDMSLVMHVTPIFAIYSAFGSACSLRDHDFIGEMLKTLTISVIDRCR